MNATRTSKRSFHGDEEIVVELQLTRADLDRQVRLGFDALGSDNHAMLKRLLDDIDEHAREFNGNGTRKQHLRTIFAGSADRPETRPEGCTNGI